MACFIINISSCLLGPELSMAGLPLTLLKQTWRFQEAAMCSELRGNGQGRTFQSKVVKIENEIPWLPG